MSKGRAGMVVALITAALASTCWASGAKVVSVPISGRYFETSAGAWLEYTGTTTLTWQADVGDAGDWPVRGTLVAEAWCRGTGARYTLHGVYSDCVRGTEGRTVRVSGRVVALDGKGQPAIATQVTVSLVLSEAGQPPVVTAVTFASR